MTIESLLGMGGGTALTATDVVTRYDTSTAAYVATTLAINTSGVTFASGLNPASSSFDLVAFDATNIYLVAAHTASKTFCYMSVNRSTGVATKIAEKTWNATYGTLYGSVVNGGAIYNGKLVHVYSGGNGTNFTSYIRSFDATTGVDVYGETAIVNASAVGFYISAFSLGLCKAASLAAGTKYLVTATDVNSSAGAMTFWALDVTTGANAGYLASPNATWNGSTTTIATGQFLANVSGGFLLSGYLSGSLGAGTAFLKIDTSTGALSMDTAYETTNTSSTYPAGLVTVRSGTTVSTFAQQSVSSIRLYQPTKLSDRALSQNQITSSNHGYRPFDSFSYDYVLDVQDGTTYIMPKNITPQNGIAIATVRATSTTISGCNLPEIDIASFSGSGTLLKSILSYVDGTTRIRYSIDGAATYRDMPYEIRAVAGGLNTNSQMAMVLDQQLKFTSGLKIAKSFNVYDVANPSQLSTFYGPAGNYYWIKG